MIQKGKYLLFFPVVFSKIYFYRVTIFLADPRAELDSKDIWVNYRNLKVDNQPVPFILCLRWDKDIYSP